LQDTDEHIDIDSTENHSPPFFIPVDLENDEIISSEEEGELE